MKWNMILGALVLSVGVCGQSFGAGLLDRMLGVGGSCNTCCEKPCCDVEPVCNAPAPCCQPEPVCAAPAPCSSCGHQRCFGGFGLIDHILGRCNHGCGQSACNTCAAPAPVCAAPAPVCESCGQAASCCRQKSCFGGFGLLDTLFGRNCCRQHHHRGCGHSACASCGGGCATCGGAVAPGVAPVPAGAAPMPPAPLADPSASLPTNRRFVRTTSLVK
jgi:hypothetical protein